MRNVLVTRAESPLGHGLLLRLRRFYDLGRVIGCDRRPHPCAETGVEHVNLAEDHRGWVDILARHEIDTVIHCGLAPDRSGRREPATEAGVIETMRLGAAIASDDVGVRTWVVASSSAAYPIGPDAPLLHRESSATADLPGSFAESLLEAEAYATDVAVRAPHVNVSILRLQQLAGEGAYSPMSAVLEQPLLPSIPGYDPPLQLLALEDAVRALAFAAELELAGAYNVASAGIFRFSDAVRMLERTALPVLPFEVGLFAGMARRLGIPHLPEGSVDLLRFGHALDTAKLAAAGFEPDYDQAACLGRLRG